MNPKIVKKKNRFPLFYPFLIALYPVLHLYVINIHLVKFNQVFWFLGAVLICTALLFVLFKFVLKDWQKSAAITSLIALSFLSYGHIFQKIQGKKIGIYNNLTQKLVADWTFGKHLYLGIFFVLLILAVLIWLYRAKKDFINLTKLLTVTSIVLVIFPTFSIASFLLGPKDQWVGDLGKNIPTKVVRDTNSLPDIYYIVLDGHGREDTLKDYYNYDMSGFVEQLKEKGFYVASNSHSNYSQTDLSLSSSLNLKYLNYLTNKIGTDVHQMYQRGPVVEMLVYNKTQNFLKNKGYTFVTFATALDILEMAETRDVFMQQENKKTSGEFYNIFLNTTPLGFLVQSSSSPISPYTISRNKILYTLDMLKSIPKIKGPTFTVAHVLSPHPPFIFESDGSPVYQTRPYGYGDGSQYPGTREEYLKGYKNQVEFLDKKVLRTVEGIIKNSPKPPIIIVQGDHGPGSMMDYENAQNSNLRERMSILNAYYLPDFNKSKLYPSITPVNSFRLILNNYFGTDYKLLPDKSYFSPHSKPLDFFEYIPSP